MGTIAIAVPDIPDVNLIYDESETRTILKFFWPSEVGKINSLTIASEARRLAQTALIAAVDGSYAMGYVDLLWQTITQRITHPNEDVVKLAQRLGKNFVRHWWQHATEHDLIEAHIYDSARGRIQKSQTLPRGLDRRCRGTTTRRHRPLPDQPAKRQVLID